MARKRDENLWQNATTKRWHWEVALTRKDGTLYRRGGSRADRALAEKDRDNAATEFTRFEGRAGKWTVKSWADHVAESVWPHELAETTANSYAHSLENHVFPRLGTVRLDALTVPRLQEWSNAVYAAMTRSAASNALTALSSVLTRAVEAGLIPSNPARNVKLRKSKTTEEESKLIMSDEQQKALMRASVGTCMEFPILLGLKFGLRMGECLGLRWVDVDLDGAVVRVQQQAQYVKGKGVQITEPKTKQGTRNIPIPPALLPILRTAKADASNLYVCTRNGALIGAKKSSHYFRAVALKAGFTYEVPTHHDCRSTFLTHLANYANNGQGVKPHVLMAIAGHSSLTTTMRYYIRASDEDLKAAMACVS